MTECEEPVRWERTRILRKLEDTRLLSGRFQIREKVSLGDVSDQGRSLGRPSQGTRRLGRAQAGSQAAWISGPPPPGSGTATCSRG